MTFLKNISYVVLGAGLGIATVFLARRFLTNSASNKNPKTNVDKSTKIYVIPISPQTNKKEDDKKKAKNIEESSGLLAQNQSDEEPILDETVKAIIDGIVSIQNQTKELSEERQEKSTDPEYSIIRQINGEPVNAENTSENSNTVNPILAQNQINAEINEQAKEKPIKENSGKKNTIVYSTPATQGIQSELESSLLVQYQKNEESSTTKSKNAVVDGIISIENQSEKLLDNQEREQKSPFPDYSVQHQNTVELVNGGNTIENLSSINQTPVQIPNNAVLNGGEKTVKKIYVKNSIEEIVGGVALEQVGNDWNLKYKIIEESSVKSKSANDIFVSLPSEEFINDESNTIYKSFGDSSKLPPFKPPRIRKASKSEVFEGEKLSRSKFKNISLKISKKPSAQSTLLETRNKRIEVKRADDTKVLAEESNIHHNNTFPTDNFLIESRNKTLGHQLWRRYVNVLGNLFSWKRRAGDRSKLLDSSYSINNYGYKTDSVDLIEDHEVNLNQYKKLQ